MTHQPVRGWCLPADELVEIFGLSARADASPLSLSSGQRQRLSLAAALARPSRLLLLDEPEQSLDAGFRRDLATLLREQYAANGGTVVMATHDHDFAVTAGARIVPLAEGRIAGKEAGSPWTTASPGPSHDRRAGDRAGEDRGSASRPSGRSSASTAARAGSTGTSPASPCSSRRSTAPTSSPAPLSRLSKSASHAAATHAAATQAVAGAGLVIGVGVGLLLLAQALGPLALSPADASWLLLTPLDRRAVLRRSALTDRGARHGGRRPARRARPGDGRTLPAAFR